MAEVEEAQLLADDDSAIGLGSVPWPRSMSAGQPASPVPCRYSVGDIFVTLPEEELNQMLTDRQVRRAGRSLGIEGRVLLTRLPGR